MGSSRFPGKPVAPLLGRPMIEHVVRRTMLSETIDAVFVATCDEEIRSVVEGFGGAVIMTSAGHERASDRVAEAAETIDADIIVMVQGDEPMLTPEMIDSAVASIACDSSIACVNLAARVSTRAEYLDPNTIKVVMDRNGDALYFSRWPIPRIEFDEASPPAVYKQVCVIPFRREFLLEFARLPPTPLEQLESIDMLRALEHRRRVRMVETTISTHAVDTPEDLVYVEQLMSNDPLVAEYDIVQSPAKV